MDAKSHCIWMMFSEEDSCTDRATENTPFFLRHHRATFWNYQQIRKVLYENFAIYYRLLRGGGAVHVFPFSFV
jgi:hypothetical protein